MHSPSNRKRKQIAKSRKPASSSSQVNEQQLHYSFQASKQVPTNESISWPRLPVEVLSQESLMLIGDKNTGKSTLANYLQSSKDAVVLDCDIGQNGILEGCVSLYGREISVCVWVGEFTPWNHVPIYLQAVAFLFALYRQKYFGKKLVVNTMGYIFGLGELLLYQIYNIVQPMHLLFLEGASLQSSYKLDRLKPHFENGNYLKKLHLSRELFSVADYIVASCKIHQYQNKFAQPKEKRGRFEHVLFPENPVGNICELLSIIQKHLLSPKQRRINSSIRQISCSEIQLYKQTLSKQLPYSPMTNKQEANMCMVVLGHFRYEAIFEPVCVGYIFNECIFCDRAKLSKKDIALDVTGEVAHDLVGVLNTSIDFDKHFYQIGEEELIDWELRHGRVPYVQLVQNALGSKGVRNNPSKKM